MPVIRRGEVPYPPQGIGEYTDTLYTQKGFYGDWVHIYRKGNLGVPKSWSDDDLIYSGADIGAVTPSDATDSRGEPLTIMRGDGVRMAISKRAEAAPFAEKDVDYNQIRFYHRGRFTLETELGSLDVGQGDFVVIGKGLVYRERPREPGGVVVVFQVADPILLAESLWDGVGFASLFVDYSGMGLPEPRAEAGGETQVRVRFDDRTAWLTYDFDPCGGVAAWVGDPVIYRLNIRDVPGIGTSRGFLPPPAHAVLFGEGKSWFFNVLGPGPIPTTPAPDGSFGAPAHLNDYDEVWLNHVSQFRPDTEGHLWLLPRTVPHPGLKRRPQYPPNPVEAVKEFKINFDTRAKLSWTPEGRNALLAGDPRAGVFTSLYGVPAAALAPPEARERLIPDA